MYILIITIMFTSLGRSVVPVTTNTLEFKGKIPCTEAALSLHRFYSMEDVKTMCLEK